MNMYKSFVRDNMFAFIGHILIYAQGIILMPIIIKSVGVKTYGGYVLLSMAAGLIYGISSLGVGFKCRRYLPATQEIQSKRKLFYPQIIFHFISILFLSVLLLMFSSVVKEVFFKNEVSFFMIIVVLYIFSYLFYSQATDYFRYTGRVNLFSIITALTPYINIGIIISILAFFHTISVNALIASQIIAIFLVTAPLIIKIYREIGFYMPRIKISELIDDIKIGFPLTLNYITHFILSSSDRFVISIFLSVTAVGYYNPAYSLGSIIFLIPAVSGVALIPLLSKAIDTNKEDEAQKMMNYTIKGFLLIAIPFIIGSFFAGKPLLCLLANTEVANNSYLVVPIVATGFLFYGMTSIFSNILFVKLKTKLLFNINVFASLLNLLLNFIFLYLFRNIIVSAIATLLSFFISYVFINMKLGKLFKIEYDYVFIAKVAISSIFMGVLLFYLSPSVDKGLLIILSYISVSAFFYFILLLLFRAFSIKEISFVKGYILGAN